MAIDRLYNTDRRAVVAWLGTEPPNGAEQVFAERRYQVKKCSADELQKPEFLAGLSAAVFTQTKSKLGGITHELKQLAGQLLDYDCRVIIRPFVSPELNGLSVIKNVITELRLPKANLGIESGSGEPPLPHVRVYALDNQWSDIANFIMEHPPGPAPNPTLTIEPEKMRQELTAGYETMVRRAFWDCSEVHLKKINDGRSGVSVYLAYPELAKGQKGHLAQWPLPYFLKVGKREDILREYVNYEDHVDPYIPFHLGPHLIGERCCLGAHVGVIVGDFVEESESLVECARSGRAGPAIACLFSRTLAGWYRGAQENNLESTQLGKSLLGKFPRKKSKMDSRLARARELGATKELDELGKLFQQCVSTPVLVGAIHGDLHARNVRVRATDAIVIDFAAHDHSGPLVYDAASLEASLLVEGFDHGEKFVRKDMTNEQVIELDVAVREWLESIKTLYDHIPLQALLIHPNPKNPSCWFHACVRQIRLFARQMESGQHQYAAALAVALLRKATKDLAVEEPEASRRAAAYVLAERVLLNTFKLEQKDWCI
jgi:hypothetical protein